MESLINPIMYMLLSLIILLFSAILHEVAHGLVADRFGDPTARLLGRLTLNPIPHIDPFMSILLPLLLIFSGSPIIFGGAKPVPVDPFNLRDGRKDIALVSLAGPLTNIFIAVAAAGLLRLFPDEMTVATGIAFMQLVLGIIVQLNLLLAIFNLLPIPPLDGSKIFALLLPEKEANAYLSIGQYGIFVLLILLMIPIGSFSLQHLIQNLLSFALKLLGVAI